MTCRMLVLLLLVCVSRSWAQAASGAEYRPATALRDSVAGAAQAQDRALGKLLGDRGNYKYIIIRRDRTGEVEVHARWDDIILVQEGSAVVLYGGKLAGGHAAGPEIRGGGPGEWRGGEITRGTSQPLTTGDLLVIPAGIPHQVRVEPGNSVTYLVIKVAHTTQDQPR